MGIGFDAAWIKSREEGGSSAKELQGAWGLSERGVRRTIHSLRKAGVPIVTSQRTNKYFLADLSKEGDREEAFEFVRMLDAHARDCMSAIHTLRKALKGAGYEFHI